MSVILVILIIHKKWGCINGRNEVVIPCIYDNIDIGDNIFTGVKELKRFDFDAEGVPIYKYRINGIEKTTRFIGWLYVERFDETSAFSRPKAKSNILPVSSILFLCFPQKGKIKSVVYFTFSSVTLHFI